MKKKIYFIISAILQMMASVNLIANSNEIFEKMMTSVKEMYSSFPIEFQERVSNMMNNVGIYYVMAPAIICIIINAIILIMAFAGKIVKKRNILIFLSIMCILLSSSTVAMLLAIANLVILLTIKKEEIEAFKEEKKELPKVKHKKCNKRELISAACILLVYFSQFVWGIFLPEEKNLITIFIVISFYVLMFILVFVLFGDKLIEDFKNLTKNFSAYMEFNLPKYGLMMGSFIFINLICILVTKNATSVNQETVESLPKLVLIILSVIWAPVVEEAVFRGSIRRFINHDVIFVIVSAFVFGFLHATGEESLFEIIMTSLPYATLGGWLAYIYTKTDNLANNMMVHAIWNLFAAVISIFAGMII